MNFLNGKRLALSALLVSLSFGSYACAGDKAGNGGDEVGLQFTQAFENAIDFAQKSDPSLSDDLKANGLNEVFNRAKIVTVNDSLMVTLEGITQDSIALNNASTMTISVNRARWNALQDVHLKEAIALHEVASLAGIESTGSYPLSSRYLKNFGLSTNLTPALFFESTASQKQVMREKLRVAEGTYTSTLTSPNGTPVLSPIGKAFGVEITIYLNDRQTPGGLMPGLSAHYRRLDVIQGEGIGEYIMNVDFDPSTGIIILQATKATKILPANISMNGRLINHQLKASIRDQFGYVGTFEAQATNIPPQL